VGPGTPERRETPVVLETRSREGSRVEAIGAWPSRTQVKRRKASGVGKSAPSDEAQYLSVLQVYWRRDGREI
jgi:hypothetical protein